MIVEVGMGSERRLIMNKPESEKTQKQTGQEPEVSGLIDRIYQRLQTAENKTLEVVEAELEEAIELEKTATSMAKDEISLLGAYIKRDIQALQSYLAESGRGLKDWLHFDTELLEARLGGLLQLVADHTRVEQDRLRRQAEADPCFNAGEWVLGGTFSCVNCGDVYVYQQPTRLEPCLECGGEVYHRVTAG